MNGDGYFGLFELIRCEVQTNVVLFCRLCTLVGGTQICGGGEFTT